MWEHAKPLVSRSAVVTLESAAATIRMLLERARIVAEGAAALPVAAAVAGAGGTGRVVCIISGGNIDPTLLIQVMRHGLTLAGRYLVVRTRLADRPGELIKLLSLFRG